MAQQPINEAKNRAYALLEQLERALEAGTISEDDWYQEVAAVITPAYLAGDNPRAQSGHSGDDTQWTHARSLIVDAIDHDGTFLDVGCASGYLMECMQRWARERGRVLEPWGLDIAPELAELARGRLPHWAGRIWTGNVISWQPPMRFDFVRTGLEYVPARRQQELVKWLLGAFVKPDGRLIVGTHNEELAELHQDVSLAGQLEAWGFRVAGQTERPHYSDTRLVCRVLWIDAPGR